MSTPTLLIVMGTSGSGKSTVGSALSTALSCPFVDGDDLHPPSNVAKMSSGQPLNDSDREPWLLRIRQTGLQLALSQHQPSPTQKTEVKQLAEVYETSHQTTTPLDEHTKTSDAKQVQGSKGNVAVIACSSLKVIYRRLLRGTVKKLDDEAGLKQESEVEVPKDLKVVHIYLDLSRELLEERMGNRKGHFMKLDMLYSQLDTLQPPIEGQEPGVVVVKVERETTTDQIVAQAIAKLQTQNVI